jgi:hypothetical protein
MRCAAALVRWAVAVSLLLLWAAARSASAQTGQGSITGQVTDGKGALVAQAQVEVMNNSTGVSVFTRTNGSGFYSVGSLNPATYTITVTAKGFQKSTVNEIALQAAATVSIDVALKVGRADVSVTVTADDSLLSKDTSDVITTVDHSLVESLPYPERSSLEAALLVPGVLGDPTAVGGVDPENPGIFGGTVAPGAAISIAGAPAGTSSIVVDGSDVTQASYARAGVNLSGRIVQETTVITGGVSAKYGRTGGGLIVQASRPGTSEYHGAITWRHTDPFFQATPLGSTYAPPRLHENFYGFYVGGPIWIPKVSNWRHKTFFYVGVEPARLSNASTARATFFTPQDLAGNLSNTLPLLNLTTLKTSGYAAAVAAPRIGNLYYHTPPGGGTTATDLANPCIPSGAPYSNSGLYQVIANDNLSCALSENQFAQYVMSLMPTPANPGPYATFDNANGTYANDGTNGTYTRGVQNTDNRYSLRIDEQLGNRDQIYGRYTVIPVQAVRFYAVAQNNPLNQQATDVARNFDVALGYTHVFSNAVVNNARYSFLRAVDTRKEPAIDDTQDFGAKYGLTPAALGHGFPYLGGFGVSGVTYTIAGGVAPGSTGPSQQKDENFILNDDVTWQHGRNLFQFGVDLRWIQSNQYDNGYTTGGAYTFTQSNTNNGSSGGAPLATFDLGVVSSYIDSPVPVPGYYRWRYDAGYFQDDWRVTAKVTLNLGLRYNLETPRMEKFNNQPVVVLNQNETATNGTTSPAAMCFAGVCGVGKTLWPINKKEFEPRVGVSIAATRRMTLRGAFTILHLPLTGYFNQPLPDLSVGGTLGSNTGGVVPGQGVDYITNPIAAATSYYPALNAARGAPIVTTQGITPIYVNQSTNVPYMQSWNVTVQYQPNSATLLQATYQGSRGIHLLAPFNGQQSGDINVPSIPTVSAAIQSQANLSAALPTCTAGGTTTGCGNPFSVIQSGSLDYETQLQALDPYQNLYNDNIPDDFERDGALKYNAMLLSVTHREGRNLSLLATYSWSKSLDDVANTTYGNNLASGGSPAPQNPFDLKHEWSVSVIDQPSRLRVGYNYTLPIGTGQRFQTHSRLIDNIIGNLSTSGIYTAQSGYPNYVTLGSTGNFTSLTPAGINGCNPTAPTVYCSQAALPTGFTLRPNLIPGVPLINKNWKHGGGGVLSSTFVPYLNPAAFGCTTTGGITNCPSPGYAGNPALGSAPGAAPVPALGDAPRTLSNARTPREAFFDARVAKGFLIHQRYRLNLTGTFNNAFNHPVYFAVNSHTLQNAVTVCTTTAGCTNSLGQAVTAGTISPNFAATTWGQLGNNTGSFSRNIRVGAEFIF